MTPTTREIILSSAYSSLVSSVKDKIERTSGTLRASDTSFPFIPIGIERLLGLIEAAHLSIKTERNWKSKQLSTEKQKREFELLGNIVSFVDYGAGLGNVTRIARAFGFNVTGYEILDEYIEFSMNHHMCKADISDPNFFKDKSQLYDIVYFYCPFTLPSKEIEFEIRALETVKIGGVLIAPGPSRFQSIFTYKKPPETNHDRLLDLYELTRNFEGIKQNVDNRDEVFEVFKRIK